MNNLALQHYAILWPYYLIETFGCYQPNLKPVVKQSDDYFE